MHAEVAGVDLVVLVAYVVGVVALGSYFVRTSRSTEGFMAADRSLPGWAVGISIFGTYLSSISFLALPGKSYADNWNPFVFSLSLPLAAWVAARWFVPYYRKSREISAYSHLEDRFGPWARAYTSISFLLIQVARMGSIMLLVALALHSLLAWDVAAIIVVTGALVTLYTLLGGIEAVIWTDVMQSIVLTGGAVACVVLLLVGMPEGPGQIFTLAAEHDKFSLGSFSVSLSEPTFWVVLVYGVFINLKNFGIDQNYVQRYATVKSDREANRSVWLGAYMYLPISALFFFIGTALFAYYTAQPELLPSQYGTDPAMGDRVFPHFIVTALPPGFTGLLIAAIFAAAMSSVDSSLNASATLVLRDFYARYFRPAAGERESMAVLYTATLVWGMVGTGVALLLTQRQGPLLDSWWALESVFSGGMLGLFLLGLISRTAKNFPAAVGVVIGSLAVVWIAGSATPFWPTGWEALRAPFHQFMATGVGSLLVFLVGVGLARLLRSDESAPAR